MSRNVQSRSSRLYPVLSWLVVFLVPVALVLGSVRVIMFPWFLPFEYSMPGFPADPFGFSKGDRLKWSAIALDYLVNDEGISFLSDLKFRDGSPVYNERELRHMVDAKTALNGAMNVWFFSLLSLAGLGVWAYFGGWWNSFRIGLGRGGWLTVFFVLTIILLVLIAFGVFFVAFHNLFFEPGTWMFLWSDTLIRLFPERFWRDIFIYVGLISIGFGSVLALLTLGFPRRTAREAS
jgi:integral membrane protein (TIGR01906 family)